MKKTPHTNHKRFMRLAIESAEKGKGLVEPNPKVGCVIVKDNRIIAKGYHKRFGGEHAEIEALKKARSKAKGATLYVTLEPCSHFGKTPPCVDAIITSGIKEVIVSMTDPNPVNNGKGLKLLRSAGIKVMAGILEKEVKRLNKDFVERIKMKRPFITLKLAQSLDGKIATKTGDSKWISSGESRKIVHKLRGRHDAVMVGVNTVLRDNPLLIARGSLWQPAKIIVDSSLRTPGNANIFGKDSPSKVIIATTDKGPAKKEKLLETKGALILKIRSSGARVDLRKLVRRLWQMNIRSILAEGGGEIAASLLKHKLVDRVLFFIAPIVIGGKDAKTAVEGSGIRYIKDAIRLGKAAVKRIEKDFLVECDVHRNN